MQAQDFAAEHVTAFNDAVASQDFASFLARFEDDAVMRFENVPGAGTFELAGRRAFTEGYQERPPDDQMRIAGEVRDDGGAIMIPFRWLRDDAAGVMHLTLRRCRIIRMVVIFS